MLARTVAEENAMEWLDDTRFHETIANPEHLAPSCGLYHALGYDDTDYADNVCHCKMIDSWTR